MAVIGPPWRRVTGGGCMRWVRGAAMEHCIARWGRLPATMGATSLKGVCYCDAAGLISRRAVQGSASQRVATSAQASSMAQAKTSKRCSPGTAQRSLTSQLRQAAGLARTPLPTVPYRAHHLPHRGNDGNGTHTFKVFQPPRGGVGEGGPCAACRHCTATHRRPAPIQSQRRATNVMTRHLQGMNRRVRHTNCLCIAREFPGPRVRSTQVFLRGGDVRALLNLK
jgi:hypothetical protein